MDSTVNQVSPHNDASKKNLESEVKESNGSNCVEVVSDRIAAVKINDCGKQKLLTWINKQMKIEMTDGRVLIGVFLCTDRDGNVILGSCSEFLTEACGFFDEPRMLGLVMVPGRHIISIHHAPNSVEGDCA